MFASGFSWFHLIPGVGDDTALAAFGIDQHTYLVFSAWFAAAIVICAALLANLGLRRARAQGGLEQYYPEAGFSPRNLLEMFVEGWSALLGDILSKEDVRFYLPYLGTLFVYILVCNLMGLFPGFLPPTDNIHTNIGMALISFVTFNAVGLFRDPVGYLKHLAGPMLALAPFLFLLETLSLCIRPVSLTLRLSGNLFGDHMVFTIMSDLLPDILRPYGASVVGYLVPIPVLFLALATLVSFIQALVFSLLSAIYIGAAVPHHDHDDHH